MMSGTFPPPASGYPAAFALQAGGKRWRYRPYSSTKQILMLNSLRTDLRISTAEGTATNVMVGIGETYLPAFVLALTGSQLACGLVSTLPLVIGAVLQLAVRRGCCGHADRTAAAWRFAQHYRRRPSCRCWRPRSPGG